MPSLPLIGYVLLTHGPKFTRLPLPERPGAAQQVEEIRRYAGDRQVAWWADFARNPKSAEAYPLLLEALSLKQGEDPAAIILIHDVARLFRKLPGDARAEMKQLLKNNGRFVVDSFRRRQLAKLLPNEWAAIELAGFDYGTPSAARAKRPLSRSTAKARRVSALSRAHKAEQHAQKIAELRNELAKAGASLSNAELARQANERGLRTSRDKEYTDVAVARALKRIDNKRSDG